MRSSRWGRVFTLMACGAIFLGVSYGWVNYRTAPHAYGDGVLWEEFLLLAQDRQSGAYVLWNLVPLDTDARATLRRDKDYAALFSDSLLQSHRFDITAEELHKAGLEKGVGGRSAHVTIQEIGGLKSVHVAYDRETRLCNFYYDVVNGRPVNLRAGVLAVGDTMMAVWLGMFAILLFFAGAGVLRVILRLMRRAKRNGTQRKNQQAPAIRQ